MDSHAEYDQANPSMESSLSPVPITAEVENLAVQENAGYQDNSDSGQQRRSNAANPESLDHLSRHELVERVQRQMGMLQKLKSRYDDRNNKCKKMADEIGQLETNLNEAQKHNEQLQRDLKTTIGAKTKSASTVEIEEYQRTIELLEQRIGGKQKGMDALNNEIEQLRTINSKLVTEYSAAQNNSAALKQQLDHAHAQRVDLETQLSQAFGVHETVRGEMATKFADVEELRSELEHEKLSKQKLTARIVELEENSERYVKDAANLRHLYNEKCSDAVRLKEEAFRVEQEFKSYKQKAQRIVKDSYTGDGSSLKGSDSDQAKSTTLTVLEAEVSETQRRYELEHRRLQQAIEALDVLKAENKVLKQQHQQLTSMPNGSRRHHQRSSSRSPDDQGIDSDNVSSEYSEHRTSAVERDFDELLQQKDQQIRIMSSRHADLSAENLRLKRLSDELAVNIKSLEQQRLSVAENTVQNSSKSAASGHRMSTTVRDACIQADISVQKPFSPELIVNNNNNSKSSVQWNRRPSDGEGSNNGAAPIPSSRRRTAYVSRRESSSSTTPAADSLDNAACRPASYSANNNFDDAEDPNNDDDVHSSTSTISRSASQVVPRSRRNTLSHSVSSFEDLLLAPVSIETSKVDYESNRVNCISELLSESQTMNRHLTAQVNFLKDEVRRLEANAGRLNHVHNMEYLKNVLLKFLMYDAGKAKSGAERERLVEVLATMLKLTKAEREALLSSTLHGGSGGAGEWTGLISRWAVGKKT